MITEKGIMKTEIVLSDDRQSRYVLRKEWDAKKPMACLLMINAGHADLLAVDHTLMYTLQNITKLDKDEFGSLEIVNMDSRITSKLDTQGDFQTTAENMDYILKSAKKADKVIIAWGKSTNKKVRLVQLKILEELRIYADKLYQIEGSDGQSGFHPLAPQCRFMWKLVKFPLPEQSKAATESKDAQKAQEENLQKEEPANGNENQSDTVQSKGN